MTPNPFLLYRDDEALEGAANPAQPLRAPVDDDAVADKASRANPFLLPAASQPGTPRSSQAAPAGAADYAQAVIDAAAGGQELPQRTLTGHAKEFAKGIPLGAAGTVAGALQGAQVLTQAAADRLGLPRARDAEDGGLYRLGQALTDTVTEALEPDPMYADALSAQTGQALGSLSTFALPGGAVGAGARGVAAARGASAARQQLAARAGQFGTAAPMAGAAGADEAYSRAKAFAKEHPEFGLTEQDALRLAEKGVGAGLIQIATLGPLFKHIPEPAKKQSLAYLTRRMAEAGLTEYTVENAGALIQNALQRSYDPEHPLWDKVPESGEPAAVAAAMLQALLFPGLRAGPGRPGRAGAAGSEAGLDADTILGADPQADAVDAVAEALLALPAPSQATRPPLVVDSEGVAATPFQHAQEAWRREQELGITPDIARAIARRQQADAPSATEAAAAEAGAPAPTDAPAFDEAAWQRAQLAELERLIGEAQQPAVRAALVQQRQQLQQALAGEAPRLTPRERAQQARRVDPGVDDLLTAVRKLGGIDTQLESDWQGRLQPLAEQQVGLPGLERPGRGLSLDALAETLGELGYLRSRDKHELEQRLSQAEAGAPIYALARSEASIAAEMAAQEAARQQPELEPVSAEELTALIEQMPAYAAADVRSGELLAEAEYDPSWGATARTLRELHQLAADANPEAADALLERLALQGASEAQTAQAFIHFLAEQEQSRGQQETQSAADAQPGGDADPGAGAARPRPRPHAGAAQAEPAADAERVRPPAQPEATLETPADAGGSRSAAFIATHELPNGERVRAYIEDGEAQPGLWEDAEGNLVEAESAAPLDRLEAAAREAATHPESSLPAPTDAQKQAGNYKVGKLRLHGLDISIENPKGSVRHNLPLDALRAISEELNKDPRSFGDLSDAAININASLATIDRQVNPKDVVANLRSAARMLAKDKPELSERLRRAIRGRWATYMRAHYGYIRGTTARDGDHVDVFLGPQAEDASLPVFVVDQVNPTSRRFDEHKVLLGYPNRESARRAYRAHYAKGWKGLGGITELSLDQFKHWLAEGDTTKRILPQAPKLKRAEAAEESAREFPLEEAARSYAGISHQGSARAKSDAEEFRAYVETARAAGDAVAHTEAQRAAVARATEALRADYLAQYRRLMSVRAGAVSSHVAGRSKFNAKQANRRGSAYDRAINAFVQWQKANQNRVRQAALDARTEAEKAAERKQAELERAAQAQRKEDADRRLMRRLLAWQKGEMLEITKGAMLTRVNFGRDGYPTSLNLAPTDGSVLTSDKFDLAALFGARSMSAAEAKQRVRELVDAVRAEGATEPSREPQQRTASSARQPDNDGDTNARALAERGGGFEKVASAYFRAHNRGPITVEQSNAMRRAYAGADGLAQLEAIAREHGDASIQRLMELVIERSGVTAAEAAPAIHPEKAPTAQRKSAASNQPLEDFGETLEGARKHLASIRERFADLTDEQIASSTLSQLWPKADIDKIEDPAVAALYHAIREEIPTKPRTSYKLARWVEAVKAVRALVERAERLGAEALLTKMRDRSSGLARFADKVALLSALDRADWGRIGALSDHTGHYRDASGEMVKGDWFSVSIDRRRHAFYGKGAVAEIIDEVKALLKPAATSTSAQYEIRQDSRTGEVFINRKGDKERRRLATFKTVAEARQHRQGNLDALAAEWERVKARDNVRRSDLRRKENAARVGEDRRQGRDITPEEFAETFGFRGVQFGNWVQQGQGAQDRQGMLNQAYDALLDLAEVVGIPPKAVSLNGELGLAFGARGSGAAAAHYEPGTLVINLTKTKGAGSLAHEWFHALDHYFQRQRPGSVERAFITYQPENYYRDKRTGTRLPESEFLPMARGEESPQGKRFIKSRFNRDDWELVEGVRPEVGAAFAALVEALDASPMTKRARTIDQGKRDGYWSRIIERAARGFESYVIARLAEQGKRNDYLANVVRIEEFQRNPERYPYLLDSEVQPVAEAFDHLFETLETRETAQGVQLYEDSGLYSGYERAASNLSTQRRRDRGAVSEGAESAARQGALFDADGAPAAVARAQAADTFFVRYQQVATGTLPSGIEHVHSLEDAAHLLAPIRKHAQEAFMVVVTDARGKVLNVIRHSKGLKDSASVDPATVAGAVAATDGAAAVWFGHNHPSGVTDPSRADFTITERLTQALDGSGIHVGGHVVVGLDGKAHGFTTEYDSRPIQITPRPRPHKVEFTERVIRQRPPADRVAISSPEDAARVIRELQAEQGLLLLDNRHQAIGVVALSPAEMRQLRKGERVRRVLRALDATNASAAIVASADQASALNITRFLNGLGGLRVLDVFIGGESHHHLVQESGPWFRRGAANASAGGLSAAEATRVANRLMRAWRGRPPVQVVQREAELPVAIREAIDAAEAWGTVNAVYYDSAVYIVADRMQTAADVQRAVLHEVVGHYGLRQLLGDDLRPVLNQVWLAHGRHHPAVQDIIGRYFTADTAFDVNNPSHRALVAEELIAHLAETGEKPRLLDRVIGLIREWLRANGFTRLAGGFNAQDLALLLHRARRVVETGGLDLTPEGLVAMSREAVFQRDGAAAEPLPPSIEVDGVLRPTSNSNSQPIHPTEEGIRNFWRWFGDSKVVDAEGKPLVVYHGTTEDFAAFDPGRTGLRTGNEYGDGAIFFTSNPRAASAYATTTMGGQARSMEDIHPLDKPNVIPAYLSLQNPREVDARGAGWYKARSAVLEAQQEGYDGIIIRNVLDHASAVTAVEEGPVDVFVAFRPGQIKSAIGNVGTFDPGNPDIRFQRSAAEERQQTFTAGLAAGQPLDRMFRVPFDVLGLVDAHGRFKPGVALSSATKRALTEWTPHADGAFGWLGPILEHGRAGLIDRYGLSDAYRQRSRQAEAEERQLAQKGVEFLKALQEGGVNSVEEARVLQAVLTGEAVAQGGMARLAAPIRAAIDDLGRTAVELGLISEESYQRNLGSYLHRSYMKHELTLEDKPLLRWLNRRNDTRRQKIVGDALRQRGLDLTVTQERLLRHVPADWWGRRREQGKADVTLEGQKFHVLDRLEHVGEGTEAMEEIGDRQPRERRILERVYWPAEQALPAKYASWEHKGTWEVRRTHGDKVTLWRDFTKAERESMGEILDARYNIAKTFMTLSHDIASAKFFRDIAVNPEWTSATEPDGVVVNAEQAGRLATFVGVDWVRVPETKIPKSQAHKWGDLAGRYVRPEIWRDLNELDKMHSGGGLWATLLTQWKLNKTARSPVVHMNNVMSNFLLMDMADVRMQDLARGLHAYVKGTQDYQEAMDHGAFGSTFVNQEIRRNTLEPLLAEIERQVRANPVPGVEQRIGMLHRLLNGVWRGVKWGDRKMVDAYQAEDEVFRMATYMRRRSLGDSPEVAAQIAREQFLDYDIRAPWVNAARRSVLPFLSYTYRAVPVVAQSIAERPWKVAKYATIAYLLNALAYELAPGDEDEERRAMRKEVQGSTWVGTPRLLRMPWRDGYGNPVFLDIRRWIPAGDVFDTHQGQSAIPIPAPLQFGGPLMLAAELVLNKQAFTGQEIINPKTDDAADIAAKTAGWLYRSWIPSAAYIPGSHYWNRIGTALEGGRDQLGRPYSVGQAAASSIGIKLQPHDVRLQMHYRMRELRQVQEALRSEAYFLESDRHRGLIKPDAYARGKATIEQKMKRLEGELRQLQGRD